MEYYEMQIAGLTRQLKRCPISDKIDIAAFIMFNDVELTERVAAELNARCPEHDIVITAEAKGIPLAYEMARIGCGKYLVARKGIKLYMSDPLRVDVRSITTYRMQTLYLDRDEANLIKGKRILLVDDVISTGESIAALEKLVTEAGGNIVGRACVLAEGDAQEREDIIYLEPLPLLPRD